MEHKELMQHAVSLASAFITNGDLRHDENFRDDGGSSTQEQVMLLVVQMYRAVQEASMEALQPSWAARSMGKIPDPSGHA